MCQRGLLCQRWWVAEARVRLQRQPICLKWLLGKAAGKRYCSWDLQRNGTLTGVLGSTRIRSRRYQAEDTDGRSEVDGDNSKDKKVLCGWVAKLNLPKRCMASQVRVRLGFGKAAGLLPV